MCDMFLQLVCAVFQSIFCMHLFSAYMLHVWPISISHSPKKHLLENANYEGMKLRKFFFIPVCSSLFHPQLCSSTPVIFFHMLENKTKFHYCIYDSL
jgi:hypothetical protein